MTTGADSVTAWVAGTHDIATDAGAWAAVLSCGKHTKILSGNQLNTTTTRMELTAVLEAVTSLKKPVVLSVFTLNANVVGWLNKRFKREDAHVEALCMSIDKAVLARGVKLVVSHAPAKDKSLYQVKKVARQSLAQVKPEEAENAREPSLFSEGAGGAMMLRVNAWMDGACSGNPAPGGWAAILRYGGHTREISGGETETTNNHMELTAILRAVEAMKRPVELRVHTDSELIIGLLVKSWKRKNEELRFLCEQIETTARQKGVTLAFIKVAGHAGVALNERADELARLAIGVKRG